LGTSSLTPDSPPLTGAFTQPRRNSMTRKPLRILLQILLLGLLLSAPSVAYADAITMGSVSFSSLQITPAAGTILFTPPTAATATTQALNSFGNNDIDFSNTLP